MILLAIYHNIFSISVIATKLCVNILNKEIPNMDFYWKLKPNMEYHYSTNFIKK